MKTLIFSILSLGLGFGGGYVLGNKLGKKKYLKVADEEVKSVKESLEKYYDEKLNSIQAGYIEVKGMTKAEDVQTPYENKPAKRLKPEVPIIDNDSIKRDELKGNNEAQAYGKYVKQYKPQEETEEEVTPENNTTSAKPYVISPSEFADSEFDVRTLNYYSDGVLADDDYNVIKDVKGYVGDEAIETFGRYDTDVVYVRNEKFRIDYEILFDERRYSDVAPRGIVNTDPGDND